MKQETREERRLRELWEIVWEPFPPPKPEVVVVTIPVRVEDAVLIQKTKPERLRVMAPQDDGVTAMVRPVDNPLHVRVRVDCVSEVDREGRPAYRDRGSVTHEYNPIDRF
jgi:hypothetical protein